jgi:hypothetical protein
MRKIAAFIMAGRLQAVTVAVLLSILSVVMPPLTLLSGSAVALVALRKGGTQALLVMGWGTALLAVLSLGLLGQLQFGLFYGLAQWLPVLAFALLLRRTASWALVMQALGVVGVVGVLAAHVRYPNIAQFWQGVLQVSLQDTLQRVGMNADQAATAIKHMAQYFTGIFAISLALSISMSLVLARAWQAMLYNPGGFREEFTRWRMSPLLAGAMLVVAAVALLSRNTLLVELMIVGLVPFLMQALGLVHGLVKQAGLNVGWLVGLYALLLFATLQMAALLAAVGIADCFVDIRSRLAKRS